MMLLNTRKTCHTSYESANDLDILNELQLMVPSSNNEDASSLEKLIYQNDQIMSDLECANARN